MRAAAEGGVGLCVSGVQVVVHVRGGVWRRHMAELSFIQTAAEAETPAPAPSREKHEGFYRIYKKRGPNYQVGGSPAR